MTKNGNKNVLGFISVFFVILVFICAISNCIRFYKKIYNNNEIDTINHNGSNDETIAIETPPPRYEDVPPHPNMLQYQISNDQSPCYDTLIHR